MTTQNQPKKTFSFIPALDTLDLDVLQKLAKSTGEHERIYGYKVGFSLGLTYGLGQVTKIIRRYSNKPIIYDHQKAATDIPDTAKLFAQTLKKGGINEAILFPQAGPATLISWIQALKEENIKVIVGGVMTHSSYIKSEGGFIDQHAIETMYSIALQKAVKAFVVPLTRPELVETLVAKLPFTDDSEFYSPGFGRQGGDPAKFEFIKKHYYIVGRSLLESEDYSVWLKEASDRVEKTL